MRANKKFINLLLVLLSFMMLTACNRAKDPSLPLEDYQDPDGRFVFAIPEGWQTKAEDQLLTITPADYAGTEEEIILYVYASPSNTTDTATHLDLAKQQIEPFLSEHIDQAYEVVNQGETRVDKIPAMLLDFAKPHQDTYMLGRVLIVAMPFYVLVFLGTGIEADWEAFLPTFKEMLDQFDLLSVPEPVI
jgi:hypothetical protein